MHIRGILFFYNEDISDIKFRLFENKFEAWIHGAVYPDLYAIYKEYGSSAIPHYNGVLPDFSKDELNVLNQVLEVYGDFTGNELESICHQEAPWKEARGDLPAYEPSHNHINDRIIFNCYAARL